MVHRINLSRILLEMSYDSYAGECFGFEHELTSLLTRDDIAALRKECASLGGTAWLQWISEHLDTVEKFVSSSPSARGRKKAWQQPELKGKLVLAAIQHVRWAGHFLTAIEDHMLFPGLSYRDMAAKAGTAALNLFLRIEIDYWPFGDPNPFE